MEMLQASCWLTAIVIIPYDIIVPCSDSRAGIGIVHCQPNAIPELKAEKNAQENKIKALIGK